MVEVVHKGYGTAQAHCTELSVAVVLYSPRYAKVPQKAREEPADAVLWSDFLPREC